jgi:flagellar biosynthesis/type III secretory pathway chaperone
MNKSKHVSDNKLDVWRGELKETMLKEIMALEEILSSQHQELDLIIANDTKGLKELVNTRNMLLENMEECRNKRRDVVEMIGSHLSVEGGEEVTLSTLMSQTDIEDGEITKQRDTIIDILESINLQNSRNAYLLTSKTSFTKEILLSLQPEEPVSTYDKKGAYHGKKIVSSNRIFNHEV